MSKPKSPGYYTPMDIAPGEYPAQEQTPPPYDKDLDKALIELYLGKRFLTDFEPEVIARQMQSPKLAKAKVELTAVILRSQIEELEELTAHINAFEEHMQQPDQTLQNVNKVIFKRLTALQQQLKEVEGKQ